MLGQNCFEYLCDSVEAANRVKKKIKPPNNFIFEKGKEGSSIYISVA